MKKKLDILELNLNRIDSYIERADNKASFILAINGIILGILFTQGKFILDIIKSSGIWKIWNSLIWIIILALFLASIYYALLAINPRTSMKKSGYKSILYYKDIAESVKYNRLLDKKTKSIDRLEKEFSIQVKELSNICNQKMENIDSSIKFLKYSNIILISYIIINCINYIY